MPFLPPRGKDMVYSDHILDAILAAYTLYLFRNRNQGELIGDPREGQILLPRFSFQF